MDYAAAAESMLRRKMLEDIYDRMTDEERSLFIQMTMQNKSHSEIMTALRQLQVQLADIKTHQQTFTQDFISNIAGNAAWDASVWLISRLARLLR